MKLGFTESRMAFALRRSVFVLFAILTYNSGTQLYSQSLAPTDVQRRIERLKAIENHSLPAAVIEGDAAHADIPSYYWAANSELTSRFQWACECRDKKGLEEFRGITLVPGVAGVGKTFLKNAVCDDRFPADYLFKFDVRELYESWNEVGLVFQKPDLASGDLELNSLLSVADKSRPLLLDFLQAHPASFYILDSLGEIHPDDTTWVLRQVQRFVEQHDEPFVHVAVFGRPVAFREYWEQRDTRVNSTADIEMFLLHAPHYRTTGDLLVSSWNHDCWKYNLRWAPNGRSESMPLAAYEEWVRTGFQSKDRFASVTLDSSEVMSQRFVSELKRWSTQPYVSNMLDNLAGNSMVRQICSRHVETGQPYAERAIMESYFHAWLKRGTRSHNRPSLDHEENLGLYLQLLMQLAVRYSDKDSLNRQGFFEIAADDKISVKRDQLSLEFRAQDILERSGFAFVDPTQKQAKENVYRFEPIWVHRLLVEMHTSPPSPQVSAKY